LRVADSILLHPPAHAAHAGWRARLRARLALLWSEPALVVALVVTGLAAHGLNMFNNPGFAGVGDEGIYVSQAWAVIREGRLAPYTYFYDHAPGGWILLAAWMKLTGGPFTFGSSLNSGRLFVFLLHGAMIPLLYRLVRRLGGAPFWAAGATLVFSLSPLALFYQRFTLLDTIMLFWVLLSLDFLLDGWGRLSRTVLSGLCFGIALLTKETAIFLLPPMLFIAWQQRRQHQGRFGVSGWVLPMLAVASLYPLYAALKGELLPAGEAAFLLMFGDSNSPHVSLVEALRWQASRGGGGMFNLQNQFWQYVRTDWAPRDPVLLAGGAAATAFNLLRGVIWRNRRAFVAALLGLFPLYYLARGGVVLEFYVLFAIPFLCLNLALCGSALCSWLPRYVSGALAIAAVAALVAGYCAAGTLQPLYTQHPGDAGRESVAWIKAHVPADSLIISHDDPWTDLHEPGLGGPAFPNMHNHWKVGADPEIRYGVFHDDWHNVDYIIMLPGIEGLLRETGNDLTLNALAHSHLVKRWSADGDTIELWKVDKAGATEQANLTGSATGIAQHFGRDGAFVDNAGIVTSEAQAYALLRAVWSGDRASFDQTWTWTQAHLLNDEGLLAWQWQGGNVTDTHSATDADTDAALALLMAGKRWQDPALTGAGQRLAAAIWAHEVATVGGKPYLTAGDWATGEQVIPLNPSYFAPYAYRTFAEADSGHDWRGLIDTSYQVLFDATRAPLGADRSAGLPPDWIGLDRASGQLVPLQLPGKDTTRYGFDAARTYWRVALDLRWSNDGRAESFLRQAGFLRDEVRRKGTVSGTYSHDGKIIEDAPSLSSTAGALAALLTLDPDTANTLYASQLVGLADDTGNTVHWGDGGDLYAQEWGWFATALYAGATPDLWHQPPAAPASR
jgi:endo-1,4-beta-D-glucanase Y/4-amino-4-deoxy-L-arabinose transferase-like glycosyltransferase